MISKLLLFPHFSYRWIIIWPFQFFKLDLLYTFYVVYYILLQKRMLNGTVYTANYMALSLIFTFIYGKKFYPIFSPTNRRLR